MMACKCLDEKIVGKRLFSCREMLTDKSKGKRQKAKGKG
jgi:hypothetical protein